MSVLISLLVFLLLIGLLVWIVSLLTMPPPVKNFAYIAVAVFAIILLIGWFGFGWEPPGWRERWR